MTISPLFNPARWRQVDGFQFEDITYHRAVDQGTVRIAFNRPEVRNAFGPKTVDELYTALDHARMSTDVGCVLITGNGPSPKDGGWAFCAGGDQGIRGKDGYKDEGDRGKGGLKVGGGSGRQAGSGPPGPVAHPRGAAAHPLHAQDRHRSGARLGRGRRTQP